jgi:hypothetical protein
MIKFIDGGDNDPCDRPHLMLELSELLPGTEVYRLYDCILSTCANPERAYLQLFIITAFADPADLTHLKTSLGRDVETVLAQLRFVIDISYKQHSQVHDVNHPTHSLHPPVSA